VENAIVVAGLKQFLASLDDLYQILEEMFKVVPNFGLLLILSLDRHLQKLYERVSEMKDVATASPYDRGYLQR
jgi:predicted RecB family endonuclease